MTAAWPTNCIRCSSPLQPGMLQCPHCGEFVFRYALEQLSAQALAQEQTQPLAAAATWQQTLPLIPPDAPQYPQIQQRIAALAQMGGMRPGVQAPAGKPNDPLPLALAKTVGSMLLSIAVYSYLFGAGVWFATGFTVLILIHEMGHVIAMKYYGLSASPPIFIPFVGALINLRQPPRNAREEAIVGIAGPVTGTLGSLACYAFFLAHQDQPAYLIFLVLAHLGFMINLFNMLPVPPLDGGRVTAAVSPWIWMLGIVALVAWIALQFALGLGVPWILLILLVYAWPRIWATLKGGHRNSPYYQIGRAANVAIGAAYLLLGVGLLVLMHFTGRGIDF